MVVADGKGLPLGVHVASASKAEVNLIEITLVDSFAGEDGDEQPERLIYDKAADSDPLRTRLGDDGIELICPHRRGRRKRPTQDGRALRRYRRRWIIERTIAWLGNHRRLLVRHERHWRMYLTFVHIACSLMALSRL